MTTIQPCEVPQAVLLRKYKDGKGYADCYVTEVDGPVTQAAFVEAFYTTALFKVERTLLKMFASRPSTDADARRLADGAASSFAAWRVEDRSDHELLLADFTGRTRSWLMTSPTGAGSHDARTRLYFGSAVVPRPHTGSGEPEMGAEFRALLGFHRLYSRLLVRAACARLLARDSG